MRNRTQLQIRFRETARDSVQDRGFFTVPMRVKRALLAGQEWSVFQSMVEQVRNQRAPAANSRAGRRTVTVATGASAAVDRITR